MEKLPKIVATFDCASSHGQRMHSARTNFLFMENEVADPSHRVIYLSRICYLHFPFNLKHWLTEFRGHHHVLFVTAGISKSCISISEADIYKVPAIIVWKCVLLN